MDNGAQPKCKVGKNMRPGNDLAHGQRRNRCQRMLEELDADRVHVLIDGVIVDEGGPELGAKLEAEGYDAWRS